MDKHRILAFALALACLAGCSRQEEPSRVEAVAVKVRTALPEQRRFRRQIQVQGCIQPVNSAKIAARMAGSIDALNVREGDRVKEGDVLFQTDQANLRNQVLIAEQNLKVAEENRTMAEADLDIARTNLEKARLDHGRDETLFKRHVITQKDFESAEVVWRNARATAAKAETALAYRDVLIGQARTSLDIARKNLADSVIRAPYDGVVTARYHETGEFVGNGTAVLAMEDPTRLEASVYLSSIYYATLSKETAVVLSLRGQELCQAKLTTLSPGIDPLTRTFEVKAALPPLPGLVSGTLCDVTVVLAERDGLGVPADAVLPRAGGASVVFAANGDEAEEIAVQTGFATDGFTEIVNADAVKGRRIVVEGQYFLNGGTRIDVQ